MGGPLIAAAGAWVRFPQEHYTVLGFVEVARKLPAHLRVLTALVQEFRAGRYDLALLIDYPGFNLRVAEAARRHGVRVLYYIPPKLWAAGAGRVRRLAAAVDRTAVILPFEPAFFARRGMPTRYVGHPLLDRPPAPPRETARRTLGLGERERVLALFPGSRPQEVARLWPPFRDAARALLAAGRCERVVVAAVGSAPSYPGGKGFVFHRSGPPTVLAAADAVLAKSGTTTLEAALADVPMVVAYRLHPVTAWLARRVITVPWISLVNLIAERPVVEELVQTRATADRLAEAAAPLLDPGSAETVVQRRGLAEVRERLAGPGPGVAGRVAAMALDLLR